MRVGLVCSTDMLTTGIVDLHPAQESELISHPGDKVIYSLEGRINVYLPDETPNWWELNPGDAGFIPAGCRHAFFNTSDRPAKLPVQRRAELPLELGSAKVSTREESSDDNEQTGRPRDVP